MALRTRTTNGDKGGELHAGKRAHRWDFDRARVTLLMLSNGRIAGISSIVGGLLTPKSGDTGWRVAFVVGLLLGALAFILAVGGQTPVDVLASPPAILIGGLLVGFGTRMGSGCTSGHGLCGIARLSRRSIIATAVFFGVAMLTVFLARHVF